MNSTWLFPFAVILFAFLTNPDFESFLQFKSANSEFGPVGVPVTNRLLKFALARGDFKIINCHVFSVLRLERKNTPASSSATITAKSSSSSSSSKIINESNGEGSTKEGESILDWVSGKIMETVDIPKILGEKCDYLGIFGVWIPLCPEKYQSLGLAALSCDCNGRGICISGEGNQCICLPSWSNAPDCSISVPGFDPLMHDDVFGKYLIYFKTSRLYLLLPGLGERLVEGLDRDWGILEFVMIVMVGIWLYLSILHPMIFFNFGGGAVGGPFEDSNEVLRSDGDVERLFKQNFCTSWLHTVHNKRFWSLILANFTHRHGFHLLFNVWTWVQTAPAAFAILGSSSAFFKYLLITGILVQGFSLVFKYRFGQRLFVRTWGSGPLLVSLHVLIFLSLQIQKPSPGLFFNLSSLYGSASSSPQSSSSSSSSSSYSSSSSTFSGFETFTNILYMMKGLNAAQVINILVQKLAVQITLDFLLVGGTQPVDLPAYAGAVIAGYLGYAKFF